MILRLLLILTLLAGCAPATPTATVDDDIELVSALRTFDDCAALTERARDHLLTQVGPYGLTSPSDGFAGSARATAEDGADPDSAPAADVAAAEAPAAAAGNAVVDESAGGVSSTNVQEAGIDEADVVKTDGRWLYTVIDGTLRVVDVRGDQPALVATRPLGVGLARDMLLVGDRLLVMGDAPAPLAGPKPSGERLDGPMRPSDMPAVSDMQMLVPWDPRTRLWLIDVGTPTQPEIVSTMTLDGSLVSTRLTGDIARVVVRSGLTVPGMVQPSGGHPDGQRRTLELNRERVRSSAATDWLPRVEVDDGRSELLVDCAAVHAPRKFGDTGLVTVLSVDTTAPRLTPDRTQAVLGAADTVYASDEHLYVATSRWPFAVPGMPLPIEPLDAPATRVPPETAPAPAPTVERVPAPVEPSPFEPPPEPQEVTTEIHRFDLEGPDVTYAASGSVPGRLLNQWALSEHAGDLRIATTEDQITGGSGSHSAVRVLRERDGALREIGHVGDLGRGEQIYAVRYAGDVGFVVTFRQVDPLYTIDLSDPEAPRVLGELKIPGYSAYLHPLDDDHILGVGQDADRDGRTTGVQVSLFDVADLNRPQQVDKLTLGEGTMTSVEFDHRAFLHWPAEQMAVLPVEDWQRGEAGALVLTVDPDGGVERRGAVQHTPRNGMPPPVLRAFVADDRLITVSSVSVLISDLRTLRPLGEAHVEG